MAKTYSTTKEPVTSAAPKDRQDRAYRIAHGMLENDNCLIKAFGPSGTDEIRAYRVNQRRTEEVG
jgi:hypothetical protein